MSEKDNWKWQKELLIKRDKEHQKEIERLNNIINETRRILGEYKHFSTPTEEQNSENEAIVDKAYIKLHSNLQELKGDSSNE